MNFILGGMSSGLAVAAYVVWVFGGMPDATLPWFFAAAAAGMGIGLLFVFAEIGRKARFLYVLRRPQSSWMTRETYAVAVFYPAVAADLVWPSPILHAVVALAGAAFLFCQGRILHAGKGIPAWRVDLVPGMLVASGLYEGVALLVLWLAARAMVGGEEGPTLGLLVSLPAAGALLAVTNAVLFYAYRRGAAGAGVGPLSRKEFDRIAGRMRWMGHLVPGFVFAAATFTFLGTFAVYGLGSALFEGTAPEQYRIFFDVGHFAIGVAAPLAGIAGAAGAIAGGVLFKYTLVTRACHQQGFALPRLPQRGSGLRAAPARFGLV